VDNIPWAPGLCDKGIGGLIQRFGSVERRGKLPPEWREIVSVSLHNNRDNIRYSRQLVTIDTDVSRTGCLRYYSWGAPDVDSLRALFGRARIYFSFTEELLPLFEVKEATTGDQVEG